jgi:hypothetical protein
MRQGIMGRRYTQEELAYIKEMAKQHSDYSLVRLARLVVRNMDRSYEGVYGKLERMSADGELWG